MTNSIYDPAAASSRLSIGSTASGSRRHSLLSTDEPAYDSYDYANAWSTHGDKLSRWRSTYIASETGDIDGVQSTSLALPDESRFTTCLAMSEDQPLLAVGSGSYETNMFFVQSLDDQLDVKASFASKFPIYSLAFQSNLLMAGTERNTSVLYSVDRARLLGYPSEDGSDDSDKPLVKCVGTYKNKAAKSIDIAAPGNHIPTRRVNCVEFSPAFSQGGSGQSWPPASVSSSSAMFFSCLGGVVNVWDATRNQHALRVEKVSNQPLSCAQWSMHSPANLVAAAGVDGVVNVLDFRRRGKSVVWRTSSTNDMAPLGTTGWPVNDVKWSPFVPYWLASADESGQVNIWDLRFAAAGGSPIATVRHPTSYGSVKSVAWSPTHVDLLSSGSSDRTWWLHSLRVEDNDVGGADQQKNVHGTVVADKRAADDIGAVVAVQAKGSTFYTLSSCGDLYSHRITPAALHGGSVHRIDGDQFRRTESAVYARDLKEAAESVLGLIEKLKEETDRAAANAAINGQSDAETEGSVDSGEHPIMKYADSIRSLCDLFKAKPKLANDSWKIAMQSSNPEQSSVEQDNPRAVASFIGDLSLLGYGLPPGYPLEATVLRDQVVWQALERLNMSNLRIRLSDMLEIADEELANDPNSVPKNADGQPIWQAIMEREKQLIQYLKSEPSLFDPRLLRRVVKLILPHDCIAGLTLGLGICQAYLDMQMSCASLDGLVHVLLFPTVFDTDSGGNASDSDGSMVTRSVVSPDVQIVRDRIGECLFACPQVVFEMIRLEIQIQETVLKGGEQTAVAEAIVSTVKEHAKAVSQLLNESTNKSQIQIHPGYPTTTTLSASAVRMYLNSLVPMRAYDEYLINTQWWRVLPARVTSEEGHPIGGDSGWLSSYPLARTLNKQTATLVVPRFRRQIDVVLATVQKEPLSLEPRLYRDTLIKVARLNLLMRHEHALDFVANGQPVTTGFPKELLMTAFRDIGSAFLMLLEALTRHTSHRDSFRRAANEAMPLRDSLATLVKTESESGDTAKRVELVAIAKFLRQLEQYAAASGTQQ